MGTLPGETAIQPGIEQQFMGIAEGAYLGIQLITARILHATQASGELEAHLQEGAADYVEDLLTGRTFAAAAERDISGAQGHTMQMSVLSLAEVVRDRTVLEVLRQEVTYRARHQMERLFEGRRIGVASIGGEGISIQGQLSNPVKVAQTEGNFLGVDPAKARMTLSNSDGRNRNVPLFLPVAPDMSLMRKDMKPAAFISVLES